MKPPLRKPFLGNPLFPFEMVYKQKRNPGFELPDHLHDHCELVYVHAGTGTFFIDRSIYDMNAGDLFLIPDNTIHRSLPDAEHPVVSTAVFFAPAFVRSGAFDDSYSSLRLFDDAHQRQTYKIEPAGLLLQTVETALKQMHAETTPEQMNAESAHSRVGSREAVRLHLGLLLLHISRSAVQSLSAQPLPGNPPNRRIAPDWIPDALRSIDEHPEHPGKLSELARRAAVSPAHFSRTFKQCTGMNVTDYINGKRIVRAKQLLRATSDSVGRIAERCGFDSLPHFHRTFRKFTGLTPNEYRRSPH